jgi:hypothetical protein
MPRRDFETPVTVTLTGRGGDAITCSAVLERDPAYLSWNRMTLLGGEAQMHRAMRLFDGEVRWVLHHNQAWPGESEEPTREVSGIGWIRSIGMTGGVSIADESLQKFADLEILEHTERMTGGHWGEPSAEYWFLQRPSYWPAHGTKPQRRATLSQEGPWAVVPGSNLKLRMVSEGQLRDDARLSKEIELVLLPGIEIRPVAPMEAAAFEAAADVVWFQLRILIMFCWRQYVSPLAVRRTRADGFSRTWHSVAVESRQLEAIQDPHVFSGWRFRYLAGGAARLLRYRDEGERLHAAVFGYAQSFKTLALEAGLTNCVEAIERLVTLIEAEADLEREIVSRKRWRSIARALRKGVDDPALSAQEEAAIKRSLASPPTHSLKERIERVIARQGRGWTQEDERVVAGLDGMIRLRNDIVHGRLAGDINRLHVELVRSRAIFEGLFLNLLNLRAVSRSSSAASLIFQFEAMLAEAKLASEPPDLEDEAPR